MPLATLILLAAGVVNASAAAPDFPQPFDVGARYSREIHVNAAAPPGGDGSPAAPFHTIARWSARAASSSTRAARGRACISRTRNTS